MVDAAKPTSKRGGARPGAGRPEGSRSKGTRSFVTRKRSDEYARDGGVLPVDVMMRTMRALWDDATLAPEDKRGRRKALKPHELVRSKMLEAHDVAKDAAPYIHPKLAATEMTGKNGGPMEMLVKRAATSLQALSQPEFDTLMAIMNKLGLVSLGDSDPLRNGQ